MTPTEILNKIDTINGKLERLVNVYPNYRETHLAEFLMGKISLNYLEQMRQGNDEPINFRELKVGDTVILSPLGVISNVCRLATISEMAKKGQIILYITTEERNGYYSEYGSCYADEVVAWYDEETLEVRNVQLGSSDAKKMRGIREELNNLFGEEQ